MDSRRQRLDRPRRPALASPCRLRQSDWPATMIGPEVELTIVIPAFNEEAGIAVVLTEIRSALAEWGGVWEILVVDDGSADRTAEVAVANGARVAVRVENGGYGAAIKTGLEQAAGRWMAIIDADGSYNPADLPRLLAAIQGDALFPTTSGLEFDLVNGVRTSEHGTWRIPRSLVKDLVRSLAEWVCGRRIPDLNTGLKVFRRELMLGYLWALPDGFSCSSSMTLAFLCDGRAVRFVPIEYRPRVGESKFRPIRDTLRYLATVVRVVMYFRPLRVFFPLFLGIAGLALAKGLGGGIFPAPGMADSDVMLCTLATGVLVVGLLADLLVAQRRGAISIADARRT